MVFGGLDFDCLLLVSIVSGVDPKMGLCILLLSLPHSQFSIISQTLHKEYSLNFVTIERTLKEYREGWSKAEQQKKVLSYET
jgi:hypothetical protein